jgi:hypothetical protein
MDGIVNDGGYDADPAKIVNDYGEYLICPGFEGFGYRARLRTGGPWIDCAGLDGLALRLDVDRRERAKAVRPAVDRMSV